ncbi:putative membrane transporter protein [Chlorella vulgaris]
MLATLGRTARRRAASMLEDAAAQYVCPGGIAKQIERQPSKHWQLQPSRCVVAGASGGGEQAQVLAKARRLSAPVGVLAGLFGSVCGIGGGVIIVPAIVSACKTIPQRLVSGTSLAAVLSTALVSAYTYSSSGCVDLASAMLISPAAMLTAPLGARLTARLNCTALRRILGYFLLAAAPLVPLKAYLLLSHPEQEEEPGTATANNSSTTSSSSGTSLADAAHSAPASVAAVAAAAEPEVAAASPPEGAAGLLADLKFPAPATAAMLTATGAAAGLASGLLGVGGGVIVTPLLALLTPFAQVTVLGTSLLAMIPPASAALLQHHRLGNVDWRMAAALAAGTALGSVAGSSVALQAPPGYLEAAFCIGMLFLGRKTLQTASATAAASGSRRSSGATDAIGGNATEVEINYLNRLVRVPRGTTLRTALLEAGLTPHNGQSKLINCRGLGTCGTCAVEVVGQLDPPAWTTQERLRLNFPPHCPPGNRRLRLACQVACQSDLRVIKRSKFWGQGDDLVPDLPSADGNLPATATAAQVMPLGEFELVLDRRRRAQQRRQQAASQQGEQGQR